MEWKSERTGRANPLGDLSGLGSGGCTLVLKRVTFLIEPLYLKFLSKTRRWGYVGDCKKIQVISATCYTAGRTYMARMSDCKISNRHSVRTPLKPFNSKKFHQTKSRTGEVPPFHVDLTCVQEHTFNFWANCFHLLFDYKWILSKNRTSFSPGVYHRVHEPSVGITEIWRVGLWKHYANFIMWPFFWE